MYENYPFTLKSINTPKDVALRCDIVKITDSDLDWLCDFYNQHNDGKPIHVFSANFSIKIVDDMEGKTKNQHFLFYVRTLNERYIQVDVYRGKESEQKSIWTEVLDNSEVMPDKDGEFKTESYSILHPGYEKVPKMYADQMAEYIDDVVRYVLLYMQENLRDPEYVISRSEATSKASKAKGGKSQKKKSRRTIYVPRKIVVKDIKTEKKQTEEIVSYSESASGERTYSLSEWKVRSHYRRIRHKDGTEEYVQVSGSVRKRNPDLLEKKSDGVNYVLKKQN